MSKQQKNNREAKKPKANPDGGKKQKKDPKRHDGSVGELLGGSK